MQKITANVYAETGFRGCNPGFVVTREGVVLIDTPQMPADAVAWRKEVAKRGAVRYVLFTEPHGDHFSGAHFFPGTVIGHEGTRQAMLAASASQFIDRMKERAPESLPLLEGFRFRPPEITFTEKLSLHVGDHTFQLIHMPGHTPYQSAVYIPEEKVIFTSDNVFGRVQAWLVQSVPFEWLESLKRLQALGDNTLVPGHGSICDSGYLPEMSAFIQDWIDAVNGAISRGLSLEEAQRQVSLLDRYPMEPGSEAMAQMVQTGNVARLYEVLKKK